MVWLNGWLIGLIQAFIKRSHQECTAVIGVGNNIIYFMSGVSPMSGGAASPLNRPTFFLNWYDRVDSNHRPLPCQGSALTS